MQSPTLDYINGQLKAWQYVNGKCDHGTTFYLRDMRQPFGKPKLPFDASCIKTCFKEQLFCLTGKRPEVGNPISFRSVDWNFVELALQNNIFKYLKDGAGYKLLDPTDAFNASSDTFQQSIAETMVECIRELSKTKDVQIVENNPEYFSGSVLLIASDAVFYELRLGEYF